MSSHSAALPRRKRYVLPASAPVATINVTPLVDVVLVLLIIFMVVTPLLDKRIDVAVPESKQVDSKREVPLTQLVVQIGSDGQLSMNDQVMNDEQYLAHLKQQMAIRAPTHRVLFFSADERARYARLVHAIDLAKQAGVLTIGMATEEPEPGQ
jgi:biopolymer transport protein ExbD/biopolymer transport protein TolR